jgi:hypothetical protein
MQSRDAASDCFVDCNGGDSFGRRERDDGGFARV